MSIILTSSMKMTVHLSCIHVYQLHSSLKSVKSCLFWQALYIGWKNDNNKLWLALFSWHLKITAFIKSKKFNRVITTIKTSYEKRLSLVPSFMHKHMTVQLHVLRYNCMVLLCPLSTLHVYRGLSSPSSHKLS